jgi:hypothetical protein
VRTVFEWHRRSLTQNHFRSAATVVAPSLAGWVNDVDGNQRPPGEVRDLLHTLMVRARLDSRERRALELRFGLSEYPGTERELPVGLRLPAVRTHADGLSVDQVRRIVRGALSKVDAVCAPRPGSAVTLKRAAEPATAAWFQVVPFEDRAVLLRDAVDQARRFVVAGGFSRETLAIFSELAAYEERLVRDGPAAGAHGRSRARALVSLCLWEIVLKRQVASLAPTAGALLRAPGSLLVDNVAIGWFIAGDYSEATLLETCRALGTLEQGTARLVSALLLAVYPEAGDRLVSREAGAAILEAVVRVRAEDDDPLAVALAYRAFKAEPHHCRTIGTLQAAVKVASAYGRYEIADHLCQLAERIIAKAFIVRPGRELTVERGEYSVFVHHQRSGTLRRRFELDGAAQRFVAGARAESDAAWRALETAYSPYERGELSDFTPRWPFYLAVRRVEIECAAATLTSNLAERKRHLIRAASELSTAARLRHAAGLEGVNQMPIIKAHLHYALACNDDDAASVALLDLHELGWPLTRTVPVVGRIQQQTWRGTPFPRLSETIAEVAAAQSAPDWRPAVAELAGSWRAHRFASMAR